jgi:hypothetical protein
LSSIAKTNSAISTPFTGSLSWNFPDQTDFPENVTL